MKLKIKKGRRFGRLKVVKEVFGKDERYFQLLCDCGNTKVVVLGTLRNGRTKSCGCLYKESRGNNATHRMSYAPIYKTWGGMMQRCYNKKTNNYHNYGGKGVSVCDRWHKFKNFLEDMGPRPEGRTLDRINPRGNYEPSNCRWATVREQVNNKRDTIHLTFNSIKLPLSYWSEKTGISGGMIMRRIRVGWPLEAALTIKTSKNSPKLKWRNGSRDRKCKFCFKAFIPKKPQRIFCSHSCYCKFKIMPKSPLLTYEKPKK